ncbi:Ribonuclease/ribotoxin, partial [Mycena floridula]
LSLVAVALASPVELVSRGWPTGSVNCGGTTHSLAAVKSATAAGFSHKNSPLGSDSYPHAYENYEGLELWCTGKTSFMEYPILSSGAYSGGSPGADRVVFSSDDGTYCAVVTHTGASGNDFVACSGD